MVDLRMPQHEEFEFRGNAREWFGIWIVNLLLTIITLGIYSAWAKVRKNKYFYQHTFVAGRNFDYHATGMQILIGRIIVVVGLVIFAVLGSIPALNILLTLALLCALPWLIVRSLRFNAQMTSWSNVRFRFHGTVGKAALVYILYPFLMALTIYTTFPFFDRSRKRYTMNNHTLGKNRFSFDVGIGGFYMAFLAAIIWVIVVSLILFFVVGGAVSDVFTGQSGEPSPLVSFAAIIWIVIGFFPAITLYTAMTRNLALSNLTLEDGHKFHSNVDPVKLIWITLSNAVVTLCTLGLMLPWAQVRMARFLNDHTSVEVNGSLDDFVSDMDGQAGALGDAYSDLDGFDVGLPI